MRRIRQAWQAIGFAGDTSFAIAAIGGIATLGAIGAGLLATLTAIPLVLLIVASLGLLSILFVTVPIVLSRVWPMLSGPRMSAGDWSVKLRLEEDQMIATAGVSIWNGRDAGGDRARARGVVPQVEVFTPEEIVAGGGAGSGARPANDATIKPSADDPQLAAAVQLARRHRHPGFRHQQQRKLGRP